ncbi:hypothetical protein SERLA73DRAFT_175190 [Serpula lacrymans var. lacrymans S7.3]|uniref:Uncharacterized protein n=2 Tax=Serpula lacrymans var. lacrymans TaxID=341189 RepID=F8PKY7_SERL3|nr:uncharacterized protein SERLADRAFT_457329 [Serpula lacrymans var. lacrymans S7.9]EGO03631.1 hypothetical protein SERLA73DRAFT_175190 [Serpula lacrymans var. lacrymans S7.3]EGO29500.1 hypothetical protein SERLADRAFT_457329 [Serpula lacrymans var. lacrymans S7.9]
MMDAPGLGYTLTGCKYDLPDTVYHIVPFDSLNCASDCWFADRKEWKYGHDKVFTWGSEQLAPAHDKWIFVFDAGDGR